MIGRIPSRLPNKLAPRAHSKGAVRASSFGLYRPRPLTQSCLCGAVASPGSGAQSRLSIKRPPRGALSSIGGEGAQACGPPKTALSSIGSRHGACPSAARGGFPPSLRGGGFLKPAVRLGLQPAFAVRPDSGGFEPRSDRIRRATYPRRATYRHADLNAPFRKPSRARTGSPSDNQCESDHHQNPPGMRSAHRPEVRDCPE